MSLGRVSHVRAEMVKEGLALPLAKVSPMRSHILSYFTPPIKDGEPEIDIQKELTDGKEMQELAISDPSKLDIDDIDITDDQMQKKLLKQVQLMAFDPSLHPDTRLNAINIYAKVKDIARAKDLGPGPPRSQDEIIERLVRILRGVGPTLSIKAVHYAFPSEKTNESETPDGTTEALSTS